MLKWRSRRDLNSRAKFPRPTPLAGAPLQPLEYYSIGTKIILHYNDNYVNRIKEKEEKFLPFFILNFFLLTFFK
jgi:hypothetical protein